MCARACERERKIKKRERKEGKKEFACEQMSLFLLVSVREEKVLRNRSLSVVV